MLMALRIGGAALVVQRRGGWRWRGFEGALVVITQWIRVLSVRLTEQAAQLISAWAASQLDLSAKRVTVIMMIGGVLQA